MTITTRDHRVVISRDPNTNKIHCDKLQLIKLFRDTMFAGLKDSKDFADMFIRELEKLQADKIRLQSEIGRQVAAMNDFNDLYDVLRFVRSVIDYPKNIRGTFNDEGDYVPF